MKLNLRFFIICCVSFIFVNLDSPVYAKRLLPALRPAGSSKPTKVSTGVNIKVKFRGDRKGVVLNFSNLSAASNVVYELTYDSRGITQSAGGAVRTNNDAASAEVLFGTCSSGACRYDSGISNAKLKVISVLKTGKKVVKPFRLKV